MSRPATASAPEVRGRLGADLQALLPESPLVDDIIDLSRSGASEGVANHALRSYLFAQLLRPVVDVADGSDVLLFAAAVLHDVGLSTGVSGPDRFEVAGADTAAEYLRGAGFTHDDIVAVWDAIALHTSPGIADRKGPVAQLTRAGIRCDFGAYTEHIDPEVAGAIFVALPRLSAAASLADDVVAHVAGDPRRGPRYTFGGEISRERSGSGATEFEAEVAACAWGP